MRIYKTKEAGGFKKKSPIEELVFNDLQLRDKMINLRESLSVVKLTANGENELVSLLFKGLNGSAYFPRKGDNSERFDALIKFEDCKAIAEIEIPSSEILDAPRNLLDDYAVLNCRKGEDVSNIIPLVICWDLPNKRTDYWNVVTDIYEILGLKIKTISILALALHYWTTSKLDLIGDDFYLNRANSTMLNENLLLKAYGMSVDDFPGYFTPFK